MNLTSDAPSSVTMERMRACGWGLPQRDGTGAYAWSLPDRRQSTVRYDSRDPLPWTVTVCDEDDVEVIAWFYCLDQLGRFLRILTVG